MRRYEIPLVNASAFALPFKDAAFDCVISSQVIEHIRYDESIFSEMCRVLRPGGMVILGTPDYATIGWRIIEPIYGFLMPGGYKDEHITHYTLRSLREILGRHGFEIEETTYVAGSDLILDAAKAERRLRGGDLRPRPPRGGLKPSSMCSGITGRSITAGWTAVRQPSRFASRRARATRRQRRACPNSQACRLSPAPAGACQIDAVKMCQATDGTTAPAQTASSAPMPSSYGPPNLPDSVDFQIPAGQLIKLMCYYDPQHTSVYRADATPESALTGNSVDYMKKQGFCTNK